MLRLRSYLFCLVSLALTLGFCASVKAQADLPIYSDGPLSGGWQDWSWAGRDFVSTANVHSGTTSIAVTASAWSALAVQHDAFNTTGYGKLTFWVNGGTGGQTILVKATLDHNGLDTSVSVGPLAANTWRQVSIPLASLAAENVANFTGFWIQEGTGTDQSGNPFYVDDVVLTGSVPTVPPPPLNGGMAVYDDALVNGWQNWSWDTTVGNETTVVSSGASSMAVTLAGGGLSLHHDDIDTQSYRSLTFWINGGPVGGQLLALNIERDDGVRPSLPLSPLVANTWQKITLSLADIGAANILDLNRLTFRELSGGSAATFYLDDVRLDLAPPPAVVHVSIDGKKKIREVDARLFGLNTAIWDGAFNTVTTADLLNEADNQALRFPGGSASDEYHWQTNMSEGQTFQWATNFDAFANIAKATQAQVFITVNYGTGTPQEAADWVRYANKTKKLGFQYWEVGNENYGTWEADKNVRKNDPVVYATRFKEYSKQMKAVDRSIQIGAVLVASEDENANYTDQTVINPRTGVAHNGWSAVMLATFKKLNFTPDFVIYHRYEQGPGGENDAFLLNSSKTWGNNAASIRQMLNDYLGKDAKKVEITCTENNSVYSNPGKQTTSLVNGLFLADSLGNIMKTEFNSFFWWDLRNGQEGSNNNGASLYGWRKYGDYGIVNSANPAGPADRYPTFYVYKLLKNYARGGEKVVAVSSDYNGLGAYAVRDHHTKTLNLLLINKHPTSALNVSVKVDNFKVGEEAQVYTYGIPQDEAARTGTGSADVAQTTVTLSGPTFTYTPAPYSATVIKIGKPHRGHGNGHGHDDEDDDDSDYFDCN
jgi:alpha-N-arabinofuranosidase